MPTVKGHKKTIRISIMDVCALLEMLPPLPATLHIFI